MQGNIEEIKTRLRTVGNIQKITRAMKLVATANLQRSRQNLDAVQEYYGSVYNVTSNLISKLTSTQLKQITIPRNDKKLHVVISSDLGFCGPYNNEIRKLLRREYKEGDGVINIGSNIKRFCDNNNLNTIEEFINLKAIDYEFAKKVAIITYSIFNSQNFGKCNLLYTKFVNSMTFQPTNLPIWPLTTTVVNSQKNKSESPLNQIKKETKTTKQQLQIEFEPNIISVLRSIIPIFSAAIIYGSLLESKVSEHASRLSAMENASNNAEELKDELFLTINRIRQTNITQEISEIISSVEVNK